MMTAPYPIDAMLRASGQYSTDFQELVLSLVLEPFGDLIDGLFDRLSAPDMAPLGGCRIRGWNETRDQ
ncbi:MAG: hypothetical protein L3J36_10550 [Rhodobacteraceae bacterium]|nr:hypothetical protein [Paracoccaceae bacterium]